MPNHAGLWAGVQMAAFGATSPLPRVPATVLSQFDLQTFTIVRCKPTVW
jgi:hypothetical protein